MQSACIALTKVFKRRACKYESSSLFCAPHPCSQYTSYLTQTHPNRNQGYKQLLPLVLSRLPQLCSFSSVAPPFTHCSSQLHCLSYTNVTEGGVQMGYRRARGKRIWQKRYLKPMKQDLYCVAHQQRWLKFLCYSFVYILKQIACFFRYI